MVSYKSDSKSSFYLEINCIQEIQSSLLGQSYCFKYESTNLFLNKFLNKLYFRVVLDIQKSCKNRVPVYTHLVFLLTCELLQYVLHSTLPLTKFHTSFTFYQIFPNTLFLPGSHLTFGHHASLSSNFFVFDDIDNIKDDWSYIL